MFIYTSDGKFDLCPWRKKGDELSKRKSLAVWKMELVVSAKVVVAWLGLLQCECDTDERGDGDAKLFNFWKIQSNQVNFMIRLFNLSGSSCKCK